MFDLFLFLYFFFLVFEFLTLYPPHNTLKPHSTGNLSFTSVLSTCDSSQITKTPRHNTSVDSAGSDWLENELRAQAACMKIG